MDFQLVMDDRLLHDGGVLHLDKTVGDYFVEGGEQIVDLRGSLDKLHPDGHVFG